MPAPEFDSLHPVFAAIRDYLAAVAPPGRLPGRRHIDPAALTAVLPLVNLVDVLRSQGRLRFRYRLTGTTQTVVAGREISGRFVEDAVLPDYADRVLANMQAAVETRQPVYDRFPMPHPGRDFIDSERVYFPLAGDGEQVDMLLIVNGYPNDPELMRQLPAAAKATVR